MDHDRATASLDGQLYPSHSTHAFSLKSIYRGNRSSGREQYGVVQL